jgi:hypothetical protein
MNSRNQSICTLLILALVAASTKAAVAQDCTCIRVLGVCLPNPDCNLANPIRPLPPIPDGERRLDDAISKDTQHTGRESEKTIKDLGRALEEASARVPRLTILATGYSPLPELGREELGYGLYSYVVLSSDSIQSSALLKEIFSWIPRIEDTPGNRLQLNIFYLPTKEESVAPFTKELIIAGSDTTALGLRFANSFYDYKMSRAIINHICNPPADAVREFCAGDTSRGPYLFTYAAPGSSLEPVPPPFLFVDLSDIDIRAFAEYVAAFKAQIKREDISDGARINSLKLKILDASLKASNLVQPVGKAIADIIHATSGK